MTSWLFTVSGAMHPEGDRSNEYQ